MFHFIYVIRVVSWMDVVNFLVKSANTYRISDTAYIVNIVYISL